MRCCPDHRKARQRPLALLLCIALLWAQGLGLVHRIGHAPRPHGTPVTLGPTLDQAAPAHGTPAWHALTDALTGHEHDSAECRLYDQASAAEVLVLTPATCAVAPTATTQPPVGDFGTVVAPAAHALPRGPPPRG